MLIGDHLKHRSAIAWFQICLDGSLFSYHAGVSRLMRVVPSPLFHVGCPFTGRGVCFCSHGTPASLRSATAASVYQQRVSELYHLWLHPEKAFGGDESVEVLLPRLVRKEQMVPGDGAALGSRAEVERAVQNAARAAKLAATKAAKLAAASGLEFSPPPNLGFKVPSFPKADHSRLEAAAGALLEAREGGNAGRPGAAPPAAPNSAPADLPPPQRTAESESAAPAAVGTSVPPPFSPSSPASLLRGRGAESEGCAGGVQGGRGEGLSSGAVQGQGQAPPPVVVGGRARKRSAVHPSPQPLLQAAPPSLPPPPKPRRGRPPRSQGGPSSGQRAAAGRAQAADRELLEVDMSFFPPGYTLRGPSSRHPPKSWCLKRKDYKPTLAGSMVQLHWPDDGQWWPAAVIAVQPGTGGRQEARLYYETGDEEITDLQPLIKAGEVAWLLGPKQKGGAQGGTRVSAGAEARPGEGVKRGAGQLGQEHTAVTEDDSATEEEGEATVLARLRGVTKRQRSAAASLSGVGGGVHSASVSEGGRSTGGGGHLQAQEGDADRDSPTLLAPGLPGDPGLGGSGGPLLGRAACPPRALAGEGGGSAMQELLSQGRAAVGRGVQLRLVGIQHNFRGWVAEVLPAEQQVRVQLNGRVAALDAKDEGSKFSLQLV